MYIWGQATINSPLRYVSPFAIRSAYKTPFSHFAVQGVAQRGAGLFIPATALKNSY